MREDRQLLFISYKAGHKGDIHKNTISSWIRKLLHYAYSSAPEDVIKLSSARTHEVRALASSMAFRGNMDLEDVLKACTWKSSNTFTTHYLRDVSTFSQELHSLGPLVAAQSIVHPPKKKQCRGFPPVEVYEHLESATEVWVVSVLDLLRVYRRMKIKFKSLL